MSNNNQPRDISVSKSVRYESRYDHYTIQMVRRRFPWWLLLLLLPLLLLIQCHKDIEVRTLEPDTDAPITGQDVTLRYDAHFLWDWEKSAFLSTDAVELTQATDSTGTTVFRDLRCSVFSYIFYCLSQAEFSAESRCHESVKELHNFHFTRHVDLYMAPRREDLHIKLLDLETGDELPEGTLVWRYRELGKEITDSASADASGVVTLPGMRYCSRIDLLTASCYGYADTTRAEQPCASLLVADDSTAMRLRPLKERFTFYVKNRETRQPIPDALARVTLTHPKGKQVSRDVRTSIDGKGIAVYDNAFILSTIAIHASKKHFGDGDLEGGPWTVEKFIQLPDSQRVVWLDPEPFVTEFVAVDSITGEPIAGARHRIRITDPSGNEEVVEERSNRNGVFPVKAKEGSRIEIESEQNPVYRPKRTVIPEFGEDKQTIPMSPDMATLQFRTLKSGPMTLLPNCTLKVNGSKSGSLAPTNSGDGNFSVDMRRDEQLSIAASRAGYTTNDSKVRNATYNDLSSAPQSRRDIPLLIDLPPCNGGVTVPKGNDNVHQASYAMGQEEGDAWISVDFYSVPDKLTIYDGVGTSGRVIYGPQTIANMTAVPFHFTQGAVTVVIESTDVSQWQYMVQCPE